MRHELVFVIPRELWLTSNQRLHWAEKARRTKGLRRLGYLTARAHNMPSLESAHITAYVHYPTNARADAHNTMPTHKALVDGLVDYGVLPDDNHEVLDGPDPRRGEGKSERGTYKVRFVITPKQEPQ